MTLRDETTTTNIGLVGDVGAEKVATGEDGGAKVAGNGRGHGALAAAWGTNDAAVEGTSCCACVTFAV